MSDVNVVENLFGVSCRNCGSWTDYGKIVGKCGNSSSDQFRSPTRHDYRCVQHPLIIQMLESTVVGRREAE